MPVRKRLGIASALALVTVVTTSGILNSFSAFRPSTKLWFWETRIEGLAEEFLRRSPKLRAAHLDYKTNCYGNPKCDKEQYFKIRDQIVREEWPQIFDRLVISADWGEGVWSAKNHHEFLYYLSDDNGFGKNNLRSRYIPVLHYRAGQLKLDVDSLEDNRVHFVPRPSTDPP